MNNWHLLLVNNSKEIIQVFQLMLIMCYSQPGLGVGSEKIMVVRCAQTQKVLENVRTISTTEITAFWWKVAGLVTCGGIRNIDSSVFKEDDSNSYSTRVNLCQVE